MAVGDRIKVALETDVTVVQDQVDAGALEIQAINDVIEDTDSGNAALKVDVDDHETRIEVLEAELSDTTIVAKSVIIDCANNYGNANQLGIRQVDFYKNGLLIALVQGDYVAYGNQVSADYAPALAFDTSLDRSTGQEDVQWLSNTITNQRLIAVFGNQIEFDEVVINNAHSYGGSTNWGAKDVVMYSSTDSITDDTYGNAISNSTTLFSGQFNQHVDSAIEDGQSIPVGSTPSAITDRVDALEVSVENIEQVVSDGGIIGRTTSAGTGEVGEIMEVNYYQSNPTFGANVGYNLGSLDLTPGVWVITGNIYMDDDSALTTYRYGAIDTSSESSFSPRVTALVQCETFNDSSVTPPTRNVVVTSTTQYRLYYKQSVVGTILNAYGKMEAIRVA